MNIPTDFDWITARNICTPTKAFLELRSQVEKDVKDRIVQLSDKERGVCSFSVDNFEWHFAVSLKIRVLYRTDVIPFKLTPTGIDVSDGGTGKLLYSGVLTLSTDGRCKFKVGEVEYDFWQFRKLALEDILFTVVSGLQI
jgi:hypothetical protein